MLDHQTCKEGQRNSPTMLRRRKIPEDSAPQRWIDDFLERRQSYTEQIRNADAAEEARHPDLTGGRAPGLHGLLPG
jgi:hypothetical protein